MTVEDLTNTPINLNTNSRKKMLAIMGILAGFIIVGLVGYFLGLNTNSRITNNYKQQVSIPTTSPDQSIGKPSSDVNLVIHASPEEPVVGDKVFLKISATANADIPTSEITLSLPRSLVLTGEPISWRGNLSRGESITLQTFVVIEWLPISPPAKATFWIGNTPRITALWPTPSPIDRSTTDDDQQSGYPVVETAQPSDNTSYIDVKRGE